MHARIELSGYEAGDEACVCGEDLMRIDHWEPIAKHHQNRRVDSGEGSIQDNGVRSSAKAPSRLLNQCTRNRLSGSPSLGLTSANRSMISLAVLMRDRRAARKGWKLDSRLPKAVNCMHQEFLVGNQVRKSKFRWNGRSYVV